MSDGPNDWPVIHLHGQPAWHDSAEIVGTRAGLEALRDAIDKALKWERAEVKAFCVDGEGYTLTVRRPGDIRSERTPYIEEMAGGAFVLPAPTTGEQHDRS